MVAQFSYNHNFHFEANLWKAKFSSFISSESCDPHWVATYFNFRQI